MNTPELADYEKRELANSALRTAISDCSYRLEHYDEFIGPADAYKEELRGLEIAKDLIESDEQAFQDGIEAGKELAHSTLDVLVLALIKEVEERGQDQVGGFTLKYIKSQLIFEPID